jgi:hypothetical protein
MTMTTIQFAGDAPAVSPVATPLIRRIDDMEVPATGIWPLVRASHVAIAPACDARPLETAVHAGHLVVTPNVDDATLTLALGQDGAVRFTGQPLLVTPTSYGTVEWTFEGLVTCEQESAAMTLTLGYHGVYRRAGRAWAWFTGSGRISPHCEDSREVVVDLLFEAPLNLSGGLW